MATWTISGTYLEFCSCDPGCGCNFKGSPNSAEGNCQALLGHRIEEGAFDGLDLPARKSSGRFGGRARSMSGAAAATRTSTATPTTSTKR